MGGLFWRSSGASPPSEAKHTPSRMSDPENGRQRGESCAKRPYVPVTQVTEPCWGYRGSDWAWAHCTVRCSEFHPVEKPQGNGPHMGAVSRIARSWDYFFSSQNQRPAAPGYQALLEVWANLQTQVLPP